MEGVEIVRSPRARSLRLTLDPTTGRARLVLPRRAALKSAIAWADGKRDWLAAQRATLPQPVPFAPGTVLTVDDAALTIAWSAGRRRVVVREGEVLSLEGPADTVPRRVAAWLKRNRAGPFDRGYPALCGAGRGWSRTRGGRRPAGAVGELRVVGRDPL